MLLSGDEAVALAARDAAVALGTGYPGTPSTEILEAFSELGGKAQWAPNEKVALEVGLGAAFAGARALVTMKHVGLNVAADPFFTAAYTGVVGALVVVSADDPGMASSQNEQDNRHFAAAAGVPMLEPSDSQEAYDFTLAAIEVSERWRIPVLLRLTTRVCHSKTVLSARRKLQPPAPPSFQHDIKGRVMVPSNARPAHRRLREKLAQIAQWNESSPLNKRFDGSPERTAGVPPATEEAGATPAVQRELGILASGISFVHAREAAPNASILKVGMTYPLPLETMRKFAAGVKRCVAIEEGDHYLADAAGAAGIRVERKPEMYRFNELDVGRVRRILAGDATPEPAPPRGKPPSLCQACPHRVVFEAFRNQDCIVAGDIGCYTLGALPPFEAMDSCVCMGASIGVGLGLRHVLPPEQARRVVSVIGDSTFVHGGLTGLVEMVYNKPPAGHVVVIVDNGTTAMTGQQEHPGTGRTLKHEPTVRFSFEGFAKSLGIENVQVLAPSEEGAFADALRAALASGQNAVLITRQTCLLAAPRIREYEKANAAQAVGSG